MRAERNNRKEKPKKEFEELLLEVRRVTRVTTWGRRMSFRATILIGNKKWKIGLGTAKGNDVASAVQKASNEAYKYLFEVPITQNWSVPYPITLKHKACIVRLLPGAEGTGLKAGSSIRAVLEMAGYSNILSKMIGSNNKLNNALATIKALSSYKYADHFSTIDDKLSTEDVEESEKKVEKNSEEKSVKKEVEKKPTSTKKPVVKKAASKKADTTKTSSEEKSE